MRKSQKIGNTLQSLLSSSKTGKCTDGSSKPFCEKIKSIAEKGYNAYILAHSDVDGLVSASIVSLTLIRLGAKCVARAFHDISDESIRDCAKFAEFHL
jgi:single-stranded DNA-specific DHH superfamily exonuclease